MFWRFSGTWQDERLKLSLSARENRTRCLRKTRMRTWSHSFETLPITSQNGPFFSLKSSRYFHKENMGSLLVWRKTRVFSPGKITTLSAVESAPDFSLEKVKENYIGFLGWLGAKSHRSASSPRYRSQTRLTSWWLNLVSNLAKASLFSRKIVVLFAKVDFLLCCMTFF